VTFYLKRILWWSWFDTVLLLHSFQALVEDDFSCMEQGGGVSCVPEVLLDF